MSSSQEPRSDEQEQEWVSRGVDTSVAHPARRYNYWLGGKDNFAADRESGDLVAAAFPTVRATAVENRRFLVRAVRFLAGEAGIRQFLDIGAGLPTQDNVHQIAQQVAPDARVVYVDNDPMVLAHARALLTSTPQGVTAYIDADLREPDKILGHPELRRVLDLAQPVALMLIAILHFVGDADHPYGAVARLVGAMPPGSYLALSHATADFMPPDAAAGVGAAGTTTRVPFHFRTRDQVARFLDGLDLVPPGIASIARWRAEDEPQPRPPDEDIAGYAAVARIP